MVSKGHNPGEVALNLTGGEYVPFGAETSWNYEIFGRTRLLDDRLELTGNLQAFAYVNNLFDDRSVSYLWASRSIGGFEATVVDPRQLGIGLKATF